MMHASVHVTRLRGLEMTLTMVGDVGDFEMNASDNEDDGS